MIEVLSVLRKELWEISVSGFLNDLDLSRKVGVHRMSVDDGLSHWIERDQVSQFLHSLKNVQCARKSATQGSAGYTVVQEKDAAAVAARVTGFE